MVRDHQRDLEELFLLEDKLIKKLKTLSLMIFQPSSPTFLVILREGGGSRNYYKIGSSAFAEDDDALQKMTMLAEDDDASQKMTMLGEDDDAHKKITVLAEVDLYFLIVCRLGC